MAVYDQWHKSRPGSGDAVCQEHGLVPTARHGQGRPWQARWYEGDVQRKLHFDKRDRAERHIRHLGAKWCIVPRCNRSAVTEPPVLLCSGHRDAILSQCVPSKPKSAVYFIRNGSRIKIGRSINPSRRLAELSLPRAALELTIDGGAAEEARMHHRFADFRVGRSEWFDAAPELLDFIESKKREAAAS